MFSGGGVVVRRRRVVSTHEIDRMTDEGETRGRACSSRWPIGDRRSTGPPLETHIEKSSTARCGRGSKSPLKARTPFRSSALARFASRVARQEVAPIPQRGVKPHAGVARVSTGLNPQPFWMSKASAVAQMPGDKPSRLAGLRRRQDQRPASSAASLYGGYIVSW